MASDTVIMSNPATHQKIFEELNNFRLQGLFCDTQLQCSDSKILTVHGCVAAAGIPVLKRALSNVQNISLPIIELNVKSVVLEAIASFVYIGCFVISLSFLDDLLAAAQYLEMEDLQDMCITLSRDSQLATGTNEIQVKDEVDQLSSEQAKTAVWSEEGNQPDVVMNALFQDSDIEKDTANEQVTTIKQESMDRSQPSTEKGLEPPQDNALDVNNTSAEDPSEDVSEDDMEVEPHSEQSVEKDVEEFEITTSQHDTSEPIHSILDVVNTEEYTEEVKDLGPLDTGEAPHVLELASDAMIQLEVQMEDEEGGTRRHFVMVPVDSVRDDGSIDYDVIQSIIKGQSFPGTEFQVDYQANPETVQTGQKAKSVLKSSYLNKKRTFAEKREGHLTCTVCNKRFSKNCDLQIHMAKHSDQRPYKCSHCGKCFKYAHNLTNHALRHGEKTLSCAVCSKMFFTPAELRSHMMFHTGSRPYNCLYCDRTFSQKINMLTHRHSAHKAQLGAAANRLPCSQCDKMFPTSHHLKRHEKRHYKKMTCNYCDETFLLRRYLADHMKSVHHLTEKPISKEEQGLSVDQCMMCDRFFFAQGALKAHIAHTHQKLKRYGCDVPGCTYRAYFKCEIVQHKKTHGCNPSAESGTQAISLNTSVKDEYTSSSQSAVDKDVVSKFICSMCGDVFHTKRSLELHEARDHDKLGSNSQIKVRNCPHCPYTCNSQRSFNSHFNQNHQDMTANALEEAFQCETCQKSFKRKAMLSRHYQQQHLKQKRFQCMACSFQGYFSSEVKEHYKRCHSESIPEDYVLPISEAAAKQHVCTICAKEFNKEWFLKKHIETAHPEKT